MKNKKRNLILTLLLPVQVLFIQLAGNYPTIIEHYYSNGIYPYISKFLRIIFGWIPFSVGDLLFALILFLGIRFLYRWIKTKFKNSVSKLLRLFSVISVLYFCFYFFWGLNYYREPLAKSVHFKQSNYTTEQLKEVTKQIIIKLNEYQLKITNSDTLLVLNPYSEKEMYSKAVSGFNNLEIDFPQFQYKRISIKNSLMSLLQTYNGTSGYLNPLTGEAQVNNRIPKTGYPVTICHEMAHQVGWAAENEANFVGFLAAIYNDDIYFKYAGYRMAFGYCISEIRKRDQALSKELWQTVHRGIIKDYKNSHEFWQHYENPLEPLIKKGYNAYLKANKQDKGITSYNYVVDLLINYFKVSK